MVKWQIAAAKASPASTAQSGRRPSNCPTMKPTCSFSALPTPTPAPTATPAPTQEGGPTVDPAATEGVFTYPTANPEDGNYAAGHLEQLPEDDWASGN